MGIRVAVAGASGYAGGELLRLLAGHPDLEIGAVTAGTSAGKPITAIHPNLTGHPAFDGRDFQPTDLGTLGNAELIFMALPHGESAALARELPDSRPRGPRPPPAAMQRRPSSPWPRCSAPAS